jgi:lysophospholipase L1-like esterase
LLYTVGDSISLGWLPFIARTVVRHAERLSAAHFTVTRAPGAGTSALLAAELPQWLRGYQPAVVVFNCGLHDIGRTADREWQRAVDPDAYRQNLVILVSGLRELRPRPRLLWLHTTPVDEARMESSGSYTAYKRKAEDVDMYNAIAQWEMEEAEVEVLDVNAAVKAQGLEHVIGPDGVHFTDDGYEYLGELIAWRVIGEDLRVEPGTA